ncbi:TRAP transporter small permease [Oceanibacterium hippocampi]|uniref:TRAP transporter small permease protein n=1 Tax=Oceanibacterium hippocampi TaxID=745714 RepID=A0A1Y5RAU7_9PROT|nr:TRAP transporter small permease [Oceanibacterium hippocampi]SLN13028.1 Tripartite ATP-independent periplasmic transporters, DctQ component [Oceanibacterium hippocampi]
MIRAVLRAHDTLTEWGTLLGAAALGAIALGYIFEVTSRYFFNSPTTWASDLSAYMLCVGTFLLVPRLARTHSHIAIEFLQESLGPRSRRLSRLFVYCISFLVCLIGAWISLNENFRQFDRGLMTLAANPIPKWWISVFITYGFASTALYFLRHLVSQAMGRGPEQQVG